MMSYHSRTLGQVAQQSTAWMPESTVTSARLAPMMASSTLSAQPQKATAQAMDMPVQLPIIPGCLDSDWLTARAYCQENPTGTGANPVLNAACMAAKRQPAYYAQLMATPPCSDKVPLPDDTSVVVEEDLPAEKDEPNYLLWGGLALLLVAAGAGVYYYTKKG